MASKELLSADRATKDTPNPGLGDLAEDFFKSLGITEARYRALKVKLHLDPNCNCADRKRWLNEVGAKLGVDGVVAKMAKWMDRRSN